MSYKQQIQQAISFLTQNDVIAIPTETVYGLAANALSEVAIKKIFELKQRPFNNPLILHTYSIEEVTKYVKKIPDEIIKLMEVFSPGPISFLLPKKENIPDIVTAKSSWVAIRIPQHKILLELLKEYGLPLAAPSANRFGYVSPTQANEVEYTMQCQIPYILDGGKCSIGVESTIVEWQNDTLIIHREGFISQEDLLRVLGKKTQIKNSDVMNTPGKNKSHYSPLTPFYYGDVNSFIQSHLKSKIGVISFQKKYTPLFPHQIFQEIVLSSSGNLEEVAYHLYSSILKLDKQKLDYIICEEMPDEGIGKAINDRLQKASFQFKNI